MTTRQAGHFFFEPKGYDVVNEAMHEQKEAIKVGYNLQRKVVLLTIWALLIPVLIIERGPAMQSFSRSRQLVRGNGWQVFAVIVIVYLLSVIVQQIFRSVGGTAFVGLLLTSLIANVIVAPIVALAASVMYFDLRELRGELAPGSAPIGPPSAPASVGDAAPAPAGESSAPPPTGGGPSPGAGAPPPPSGDRPA